MGKGIGRSTVKGAECGVWSVECASDRNHCCQIVFIPAANVALTILSACLVPLPLCQQTRSWPSTPASQSAKYSGNPRSRYQTWT